MRTSLAVQWLRFYAPNAEGMVSIPNKGTCILHTVGMAKNNNNKIH